MAEEKPKYFPSNLRNLVDSYEASQVSRVRWGNRITALEGGVDIQEDPNLLQCKYYFDRFYEIERTAFKEMSDELMGHRIYTQWMTDVPGIAQTLAARWLADLDIRRAPHISSFWKISGLGVREDGRADRKEKKVKLVYNARLKVAVFLTARSFHMLRSSEKRKVRPSPYIQIYDKWRAVYDTRVDGEGKPWPKGRCHLAANRKMVAMFLAHLWMKWRELEGLPVEKPYAHAELGHTSPVITYEDLVRKAAA